MDPKKDIWQEFSAQQDAWDEMPPASAWDKLSARLDAAPPAHPGRPWKPFALPGAGIVLVVLMGLALLRTGMQADNGPSMRSLPDLPPSKALVVEAPADRAVADAVLVDSSDRALPDEQVPDLAVLEDGLVEVPPGLRPLVPEVMDGAPLWDSLLPSSNVAAYNYDNASLNPGQMVVTNGFGNVLDTVGSLGQYRGGVLDGVYNSRDNQYLQLNMRRNDVSYSPRGRRGNENNYDYETLDHFNWLLGSWKREGPSGATHEQWRQLDAFTIEGRGYFTVNGDTMVTEKMRIEQRGEDVYYIVALDTNMRPVKFRLRSYEPGELIFENPDNAYPQEIIVRKDDMNNFSTTLQNGQRGFRRKQEEVRSMQRAKAP